MSNIAVAVTSFILGIECIILSGLILNQKTQSPTKIDFFLVLLGIAFAALLNSVLAGFIRENTPAYAMLWKSILVTIGLLSFFLYSASIKVLHAHYIRYWQVGLLFVTLGYIFVILFYPKYFIAILFYYFAVILLFYTFWTAYQQTKHRQIKYGLYALVLVSLAPLFQQSLLKVGPFTGNLIYNLLMILGIYFCYIGVIALMQKHTKTGLKDIYVNDLHSRMNETVVAKVIAPSDKKEIYSALEKAIAENMPVSISGFRHSMGGQQFAEKSLLLDMRRSNRVVHFNKETGVLRAEAGITWPELFAYLHKKQRSKMVWTFAQKQTGADYLTLGGALGANIHGRGLTLKPFVQDVLSFELIDAKAQSQEVRRGEELFKLAVGGYGLFGVVSEIEMQLVRRQILQRKVEILSIEDLALKFKERVDNGFLYGDFQFKTNEDASDFLQTGVFSCYKPVEGPKPSEENRFLRKDDWNRLLLLAHIDKEAAFKNYCDYYMSTDGQCYWSDTHQMSFYNDKYLEYIRSFLPDFREGSLMITEVYVPLNNIGEFMKSVAEDPALRAMDVVYGTVRLIKKDDETFLAWAKEDYACIIFNLHVPHHMTGIQYAGSYFSGLIDHALAFNGCFYLTYHRFARKDQILKAYPQFPEFLSLKLKYDPNEVFQSTWYQYYKRLFLLA